MNNHAEQEGYKPKNGSDPASPVQGVKDSGGQVCGQLFHGLTKRETIAIAAMQAMLTNAGRNGYEFTSQELIADDAANMADALLKSLEQDS